MQICDRSFILGAQLRTDLQIYGTDGRDAQFWIVAEPDGFPVGALSLVDGRMTAAGEHCPDPEELAMFLKTAGGCGSLTAPETFLEHIPLGDERFCAPAMHYPGGAFGIRTPRVGPVRLQELYEINCAVFPGFQQNTRRDKWMVATSRLLRGGWGSAWGIREGDQLVSTASVSATGPSLGVIANVATLPGFRGRGHAGTLVRHACDRLLEDGKTPTLLCANESLGIYYAAMGFVRCGRWARITWKD